MSRTTPTLIGAFVIGSIELAHTLVGRYVA